MVLFDSGNFSANPTPQGIAKTEAMIEGMGRLGYSVVNLGERDIRVGFNAFAERTRGARFPMVSANIIRNDSRETILRPSIVIEASSPNGESSVRVGVMGLMRFNPIFRKDGPEGSKLEIIHPSEVIGREIKDLRAQKVDVVVLLAALHRDDARRIVKAHPGIDFVVGSYGGVYMTEREPEGETWLLYGGNQGKRLGETRVFFGESSQARRVENKLHFLSDVYPFDPDMQKFVNETMRGISENRPDVSGGSYVGSKACMQCHPAVHEQWASTEHAKAMAALESEKDRRAPGCLKCHTTGFGKDGGFTSPQATPQLAEVGCESCHGAGRGHIARPAKGYGKVGLATCQPCHDLENSPDFDYYSYRARIVHRDRAER
jgi:hypothetical protein